MTGSGLVRRSRPEVARVHAARSRHPVVHASVVLRIETRIRHAGFVGKRTIAVVIRRIFRVLEVRLSDASRDGGVPLRAVLGNGLRCKNRNESPCHQRDDDLACSHGSSPSELKVPQLRCLS